MHSILIKFFNLYTFEILKCMRITNKTHFIDWFNK